MYCYQLFELSAFLSISGVIQLFCLFPDCVYKVFEQREVVLGQTQQMTLVSRQKQFNYFYVWTLQSTTKYLENGHMQDVIVGVQQHQIPQKTQQRLVDKRCQSLIYHHLN